MNALDSKPLPYEKRLDLDLAWALREGSMHFEKDSAVHRTLRKITHRLDELGIPYSLAGAMALFVHGYRRFTEVVDLLVTPAGLQRIHQELEGLGYVPPFAGSKQLRDGETGVRIEFLVAGQFPGDGKPKPVAFPDPGEADLRLEGMNVLDLAKLVELKLASGMTGAGRLKDLADVEQVVRILKLDRSFAERLDPYVRPKFLELVEGVEGMEEI